MGPLRFLHVPENLVAPKKNPSLKSRQPAEMGYFVAVDPGTREGFGLENRHYDPAGNPWDVSAVIFNRDFSPGCRIRLYRVAPDWRQCDLGHAAWVTPSNISALERDLPIPDTVTTRALKGRRLDTDGD